MTVSRRFLLTLTFSLLFSTISYVSSCKAISAKKIGMIPNDVCYAAYNSNKLAVAFNNGYEVRINKKYYIGEADIDVHGDISIKGSGSLILVDSQCINVISPISIDIKGILISTTKKVGSDSQIKLISNVGRNYHHHLRVKKCHISGVRIYTHVADDVDQNMIKDGVHVFEFRNNVVDNVGYYLVRLDNCLCQSATIENNQFHSFYSNIFGFGVSNEYSQTLLPRLKNLCVINNTFDNKAIIINEDYKYTYFTPIIAEGETIICRDNVFTNIIADTKSTELAVYPFYLSGNNVIIEDNIISDCLNISNSAYNEIFKCKSAFPGFAGNREIIGNSVIVTDSVLQENIIGDMPYIRMINLQHDSWDTIIIKENNLNLACDFVFGAGYRSEYKKFIFENNNIKYHSLGPKARSLLRLNPATEQDNNITVIGNKMYSHNRPTETYGLYLYDCNGYTITVKNNILSGALPYGAGSTNYTLKYGVSENNFIDVGSAKTPIRIAVNLSINDTISSEVSNEIIFYPQNWSHSVLIQFHDRFPNKIIIGNQNIQQSNITQRFHHQF